MTSPIAVVLFLHAINQVMGQDGLKVNMQELNNVKEPLITLQFINNDPREVELVPGKAYEFVCISPEGFQSNVDIWYNGTTTDHPVTDDAQEPAHVILNNGDKNTLKFEPFDSTVAGTYSCQRDGMIRTIIVQEGDPIVVPANLNITLTEGSTNGVIINVIFSSSATITDDDITWRHNGAVLDPNNVPAQGYYILSSNDLITNGAVSLDFAGTLSATLATSAGTTTVDMSVRVIVRPTVSITASSSQPTIGDSITLTCRDSQGIPASSFTWSVGGTNIASGSGGYTITSHSDNTSVLTISSALFNHSNAHTCKAVNEAGESTSSVQLNVLLPPPTEPVTAIVPPTGPHYSGSTITLTCQATMVETDLHDGPLSPVFVWTREGMEYKESTRVSIDITPDSGLTRTSELTLSTTGTDSGEYMCSVKTTSNGYNSSTVSAVVGTLNIEDPLLSLYLTPDSGTVPNLNPYNTITFNCTVDIPNQITVQHTFDWLLNNEPISNDDGDIVHTETYSTLRVNASTPGNAIYSCCLHLPIHESPITIMRNATIIVTGPSSPNTPTDVTVTDITHNSAVVHWTVPSITYSPETYTVRYGTARDDLSLASRTLSSGSDFVAKNQDYEIQLNYLEQDRIYYYAIMGSNTHSNVQSTIQEFRTASLDIVQVKAGPFRGCVSGRVLDSDNVISFISDELSTAVEERCGCTLPSTHFINVTLLCTEADSNNLVYRAYVVPSESLTSAQIISHISSWVEQGPTVVTGVAEIMFDSTCEATVPHIQAEICEDTETETNVGSINNDAVLDSNTLILLAVVLGAVIMFLVFIVILMAILAGYQYRRIRSLTRKRRSDYAIVRRASMRSSIRSSSVPPPPSGNDWQKQGEVYVTTECPAYLTSYQSPKPDVIDMVRDATPGIYDSIDTNLNGRGLRPPPVPTTNPPSSPPRVTNPLNGEVNSDQDFKCDDRL